jgi:hypothetical protein
MRTRLIFFIVAVISLTISPTSLTSNAASTKLEILAITDTKPGEVEVTFNSKIAKSLITSYQINAKPKTATGASFSKNYKSKISGLFTHKISNLTPKVEYTFSIRLTTKSKQVITSASFNYIISSTTPTAPLITKVVATDADEAVLFFDPPIDDGGTTIYYYTALSNPGGISSISPQRGPGSITITGLSKSTTYIFTINAFNINGSSLPSKPSLPVTTLAEKIVRSSTSSTTSGPTLAAPAFTLSSSSQTVVVSNAITTVANTSTGGAIASYAISPAAPAGLTFSTSTGQLSGTPTATQSATPYTITATNASGSATQTFTLTVTVAAPAFSISSSAETRVATTALVGYSITSTGGAISSYALTGTLPAGLSFSTSTGLITGTPTETKTATTYTITATNASGSASREYALRVTGDIGDTGPGGGKIFYYLSAGFTCGPTLTSTCKYLEAATTDWSTNYYRWSGDTTTSVTTSTAIGAGYKNTLAIVARSNLAGRAGTITRAFRGPNNFDDWYLPSKDELGKLYIERALIGITSNYYWTSSETSSGEAWNQNFNGGSNGASNKNNELYVRPIRAF